MQSSRLLNDHPRLAMMAALGLMMQLPMPIQDERLDISWPKLSPHTKAKKKARPVGEKFAEQYQKRYASIASTKPSKFLGFRKVRKFIPETRMSVWVKV